MQSEGIFKKILVPTDGSSPSMIAQELTAFIAKIFKSKVTVIHIVAHELMHPQLQKFLAESEEYVPITPSDQGVMMERVPMPAATSPLVVYREISDLYRQRGEEVLKDSVAIFKKEGIPVDEKLIELADPAETIINETERGNYDLIVIGHSGEEEQEPHLGSVAKKVSQHVKIPVLIAREKRQVSKILVPVDGSENSEKALQYAALLTKKTNAEMTLLYVQESGLFKLRPEVSKKIGARILSEAADQIKGIKLDRKLESGDPARTITQTASEENYDLIVMGSKGHSAVAQLLLGSVTDHVIHYANRSVLIIK